jgi:hypothetical protein
MVVVGPGCRSGGARGRGLVRVVAGLVARVGRWLVGRRCRGGLVVRSRFDSIVFILIFVRRFLVSCVF